MKINKPRPVKLITGFIFKEEAVLDKAKVVLERHFGKIDFLSLTLPFRHTDYYEEEFGKELKRAFACFRKLVLPHHLAEIKIITNRIEKKLSVDSRRLVNIDPGYLDSSKLILASTKDFSHRIYLNRGIFAEVTLIYQNKTFNPWPWTYPDYKTAEYIAIFNQIREIYRKQIIEK